MSEVTPGNPEKLSLREKRAQKRMAKLALKQAEQEIEALPESQIMKNAAQALDHAKRRKTDRRRSYPGNHYNARYPTYAVDYDGVADMSKESKHWTWTATVPGEEFGFNERTSLGLLGTRYSTVWRDAPEFMSTAADRLYLATYYNWSGTGEGPVIRGGPVSYYNDNNTGSVELLEISPEYLGGLQADELDSLATIVRDIAASEGRHIY